MTEDGRSGYRAFEKPFQERARPILHRLQSLLSEAGYGPMISFDIDSEVGRGLAFMPERSPAGGDDQDLVVQLMLEDLTAEGQEGVGLQMECSIHASGVAWVPGNYTPEVSITSVEELVRRLDVLDELLPDVMQRIVREWERTAAEMLAEKSSEMAGQVN